MESQHADLKIKLAIIGKGDRGHSKSETWTWEKLCTKLDNPLRDNNHTLEQYKKLSGDEQLRAKDVGSFAGGQFRDGVRKLTNLKSRNLLTLDIDSATAAQMKYLLRGESKVSRYEFFASTTRKHSPEKPRWRAVFPLTRPLTVEEYGPFSRIVAAKVFATEAESMEAVDDVSFRPAQIMYWPSVCKGAEFRSFHNEGRLLNPDKIFEKFGDWKDWTRLPYAESRGLKMATQGKKAEDPRDKKGLIGAFCRAFDVEAAISEFLPDVYELGDPHSNKPRYTYTHGSSSNGAVVEDDGLFLYSHHGTDPCSERLVNAFDLVRIHKFGDLDNTAPADARPTELPSFGAMKELCRDYPEIQAEYDDYSDSPISFSALDDDEEEEETPKTKKEKTDSGEYKEPNMVILRQSSHDAPDFPVEVMGEFWAKKAAEWAKISNAPLDFTSLSLIVGAASCIGNSRWVEAKPGWSEPPVLWCMLVGRPSTNKSPAMGLVTKVLSNIEAQWRPAYEEQMREWESEKKQATLRRKIWERDIEAMLEGSEYSEDDEPLPMPRNCLEPDRPQLRRLYMGDSTLEKMMLNLSVNPRGMLSLRDELSGWFANLSRYSNGTDRPAWLEAYGGRPYTVDRVKYEDRPIYVRHFSVSLLGGMQPERLMNLLSSGEDGLQARFIYAWPEQKLSKMIRDVDEDNAVELAYDRLAALMMEPDKYGNYDPIKIPLSMKAWEYFSKWATEHTKRETMAVPALQATYGKANGLVVRLALVLQLMWWASDVFDEEDEPKKVSLKAIKAAIRLRDEYIKPMQVRVFDSIGVTDVDQSAGHLARWILSKKPKSIDVRTIMRERLPKLRDAKAINLAIEQLVFDYWIYPKEQITHDKGGRPKRTYVVNPLVYEAAKKPY